ncbi:MAG: SagB/ThcOx family dehydrogenase [Bacteroidaceae bacterium]|nr:SagB/ThcOx family dehydrogenase [Bacteroidaceae bacterium]
MKKMLLMAAMLMATACGAEDNSKLPAPNMKRKTTTVMEAYKQRRSQRKFSKKELRESDLSDLLWAAQGKNRDDGRLTMPSCMNWQEIRLYVFDSKGVSLYDPQKHELQPIVAGDYRQLIAGRQDFVLQAPVSLLLVADLEKNGKTDARAREFAAVDAGICTQNICLFCAAAGLATVPRASMEHEKLAALLKLSEHQIPMMNCPVGYPSE